MAYPVVELTADQKRMWDETRIAVSWCAPHIDYIFKQKLSNDSKQLAFFSEAIPSPAATDGSRLMFKPSEFFSKKFTLMNRVAIVVHEVLHCVFDHCGRAYWFEKEGVTYPSGKVLPYIALLMNCAEDYVINDMIVAANNEMPGSCGELPKEQLLWDHSIATRHDSTVDTYAKLFKQAKITKINPKGGRGAGNQGKDGQPHGGFDIHLKPGELEGKEPGSAANERDEQDWEVTIAAAAQIARVQGKLPASMDKLFEWLLQPKIDWQDQFHFEAMRRIGHGGHDWRRPERSYIVRDIYAPSRADYGCELAVMVFDTSGSIGPADVRVMAPEMAGVMEQARPRRTLVIECDAAIHRVQEMEETEDLRRYETDPPKGGGGTSFIPPFEWVAEQGLRPDVLIYFTDGQGSFPSYPPSYPVIWASVCPESQYPWGDVVQVPKQEDN